MVIAKYNSGKIRDLVEAIIKNNMFSLDPKELIKRSEAIRRALIPVEQERDRIETPPHMGVGRDLSGKIIRIIVLDSTVESLVADANSLINQLEQAALYLNSDFRN